MSDIGSNAAPSGPDSHKEKRQHQLAAVNDNPALAIYTGGGYGPQQREEDDDEINLRELWQVIVRRRGTIFTLFTISVIAALIATFLMTPIYRASLTLQIEREAAKIVQFEEVTPVEGANDKDFYQTQYELLKSRTLARRVIEKLGLASNQTFAPEGKGYFGEVMASVKAAIYGEQTARVPIDPMQKLEDIFLENLTIEPIRNSRLVRVHVDSPDPVLAARIGATLADTYISMNLERRFDASSYAKEFLEDRIKQVKARLEDSEQLLVKLAREQEIIDVETRLTINDQKLGEVSKALTQAEQQRIEAEAIYAQMQQTSGQGIAEVLDSKVIQTLKETRAALEAEYQDKLSIYKPAYPRMEQLRNQIGEIQAQIDAEVANIRSAIRAKYLGAVQKQDELRAQLERLKEDALNLQDQSVDYNIAKREVDTNRQLYEGLLQRMKEVGVAAGIGTNNISVVDPPAVPNQRHKPSLKLNLLLAGVLGLFLGIGLAFLFEHFDDTFKNAADLERKTGLALLGMIPEIEVGKGSRDKLRVGLASHDDPKSALAEAYRSLRTSLMFSTANGAPKLLHFTSSAPGEGKTTSALNAAITFAQTGGKVLLVDADLRNPSLHKELKLDNSMGLTNYLASELKPGDIAKATEVKGLYCVPSGPIPPNPAELLAGAKMMKFLTAAREKFDYVVIDGPPVLGLADALILANHADGTALVVESDSTRQGAVEGSIKRLRSARATMLGAVLSKIGSGSSAYGYDYHYKYHYYYYQKDDADNRLEQPA